jgi:predicted nucleotidyltransferase
MATGRKVSSLEEIKKAVAPVLKKGGAQKAIVFGSYARGDADEYSDLDIIIIKDTEAHFFDRHKDFRDIWDASPVKGIDMLIYTPNEFKEMQEKENGFILTALEDGVVIYEAGS